MNILLIEDNEHLAASIGEYLEARGHSVDFAYNGRSGLELAAKGSYHILVVDIGLPQVDGLELCRRLRHEQQNPVPVLILTARDTLDDKIQGFHAGGDDYLVKPFAMQELEARLLALHRRSLAHKQRRMLKLGELTYDLDTQQVEREGVPILLQPASRKILEVLMRNANRVVRKQELEDALWGGEPHGADALRVHIHALRAALDGPFEQPLLHTLRATGYRLGGDENQPR